MDYTELLYEVEDGAAVITFNRPERLNAWTGTMGHEYRDALARAEADRGARAIIVTGAGRGFCAGADMGTLHVIAAAGKDERAAQADPAASGLERNYRQPYSFPLATKKPLLGAINGPAVGLGLVMALYCDLRFASEQARFGTAFASLGLVAEHGVSWLLPRTVGMANALDLLYSARIVSATEALRMGLVSRVLPPDQLLPATKEYARYLADHSSPRAMAAIKRLVWDAQFTDLATAVESATTAMEQSFGNPDFTEGLAAFAEKRSPRFAPLEA